jgi:hypothetical protein
VAKSPGREREQKETLFLYIYSPLFSQLYIPGSFHLRERDTGLRPAPRLTAKSRRFTTLFGPHIPPRGFPPLFFSLSTSKRKREKIERKKMSESKNAMRVWKENLRGNNNPGCFVL